MMKELVIFCFFGLCFALSVGKKKPNSRDVDSGSPQFGIYTDVDVNDPGVQVAAKHVLESLQKDPVCSGFTLLDVTKAKHKLGGAGVIYDLKLRFKTDDNETKKCKLKVHGDILKISGRQMSTESKPTPPPYQKGCTCRDLNPTYVTSE